MSDAPDIRVTLDRVEREVQRLATKVLEQRRIIDGKDATIAALRQKLDVDPQKTDRP